MELHALKELTPTFVDVPMDMKELTVKTVSHCGDLLLVWPCVMNLPP